MLSSLLPLLTGFAVVFGLIIGSFLNVVIYRVPAGLSVVSPRSACPNCSTPIRERDNIPVVSWVLLRGKCRDCANPISARYPGVEIATGVLFGLVTYWFLAVEDPALLPVWIYLAGIGVALFMIDLDVSRLPDAIVLPSYVVVAALLALAGFLTGDWPIQRTLTSALVWAAVFGIPYLLTSGRGMGLGDVKLAPILGAALGWLGWGESLVALMAGFLVATFVGLGLIAASKAGRKSGIPYGPFMLGGALVGVLAGDPAWDAYLRLTGLA